MIPLPLLMAGALACTVENAHYALRTAPDVTASFRDVDSGRDWPSGLAMRIHIGTSGRTYWFLPWNGGTDDLQHLASTRDVDSADWRPPSPDDGPRPLGDLDYIATDQTYRVLDHVPSRGEQAPAHILLPTLGDALWHRNFAVNDHRDSAPKQFFDLTACSPRS